jgi:hypothetical protein
VNLAWSTRGFVARFQDQKITVQSGLTDTIHANARLHTVDSSPPMKLRYSMRAFRISVNFSRKSEFVKRSQEQRLQSIT